MDGDCWAKVFDLLRLREILSMSQTCRRMHRFGGHYYREHFNCMKFVLHIFGAKLAHNGMVAKIDYGNCFPRFLDSVIIKSSFRDVRRFMKGNLLKSLRLLMFQDVHMKKNKFYGFENRSHQIERVYMLNVTIYEDFIGHDWI